MQRVVFRNQRVVCVATNLGKRYLCCVHIWHRIDNNQSRSANIMKTRPFGVFVKAQKQEGHTLSLEHLLEDVSRCESRHSQRLDGYLLREPSYRLRPHLRRIRSASAQNTRPPRSYNGSSKDRTACYLLMNTELQDRVRILRRERVSA